MREENTQRESREYLSLSLWKNALRSTTKKNRDSKICVEGKKRQLHRKQT